VKAADSVGLLDGYCSIGKTFYQRTISTTSRSTEHKRFELHPPFFDFANITLIALNTESSPIIYVAQTSLHKAYDPDSDPFPLGGAHVSGSRTGDDSDARDQQPCCD
jgi:hypothetical protein